MTHPSWVALHGMSHNFIELDKAVIHVINEISSPIEIFRLMKLCVCVCVCVCVQYLLCCLGHCGEYEIMSTDNSTNSF